MNFPHQDWDNKKCWYQQASKRWVQVVVVILLLGLIFLKLDFQQPYIREGNLHYTNPYGEEGAQRLPQAIVIGIRKAGTRAMLRYLKQHPNVRTASAECHFFASTVNYNQGYDYLRKQMPYSKANQITIEKTPNYFHNKESAPRIHHMNSSIKLILVLREPVKRAQADFWQFEQNKVISNTTSFASYAFTSRGEIKTKYGPIKRSNYYDILKRFWLPYFPLSQILVVNGDALGKQNPGKEMVRVQEFLGIKPLVSEKNFYFNKEKGFYCIKKKSHSDGCLGDSKGRKYPKMDEAAADKLRSYYAKYNRKLFNLIGRDFEWNS